MATDMTKIVVYVPADEAEQFKQLLKEQDKTVAAVLRRLIRSYLTEFADVPSAAS